jgi:hypothetical protein
MKIKARQALPKAKRTMPAPKRLSELIELINLLPVDAVGLRDMFDNIQSRFSELQALEINKVFLNEFDSYVQSLPPKIKEYIGEPRDPKNPSLFNEVAARRYNLLVESLDLMGLIASQNNAAIQELRTYSKQINEKNIEEIWALRNLLNIVFSICVTPMEFVRNEQGKLEKQSNILIETMQEGKHLRIRQCLICGLFFWAGRIDQPACSKRCTQTLRVRRWREKYQDKYKQQRIQKAEEQEQRQKKLKKGRK